MAPVIALMFLLTPEAPYLAPYLAADVEGANPRYVDCVKLVAKDLDIGRAGAQQWAVEGGGAPAQHCLAIADLAAGFPRLAAIRLQELSERSDAGDAAMRGTVLAEAALAWLDANDPAAAETAIAEARSTAPDLPELDIVAAKVFAAAEKWQAADDAVTAAQAAGMHSAEAYLIRARARRALGKGMAAAEDVVAALKINPFDLDALVLRGELQQAGIAIEAHYGPAEKAPD